MTVSLEVVPAARGEAPAGRSFAGAACRGKESVLDPAAGPAGRDPVTTREGPAGRARSVWRGARTIGTAGSPTGSANIRHVIGRSSRNRLPGLGLRPVAPQVPIRQP